MLSTGTGCFQEVVRQLVWTVHRALTAAASVGAASVAVPPLSGGIFCHGSPPHLREMEQLAARTALVEA
eukprot:COSAG01_NODE_31283_length_600_cov_1.131737_2_plen_68_part_01